MRRFGVRWLVGAVTVAATMVAAPQTSFAATYSLGIRALDYRFSGIPSELQPGDYDTRFINSSRSEPHEAIALNLGPECANLSRAQVIALLEGSEEEAFARCPSLGFSGAAFALPRGSDRTTFSLTPGRTMFVCFIPTPRGTPHFKLGMLSFTNVRGVTVG